ncbi:hypothetical protein TNCV_1575041 [Trichonephila clavipes]|nr:hypothetical protein TNCV_1575041 [Trichonephila clavipes]
MKLSEGRFDLSTFRSERTNEASTLTITPKRSSSRDVGTSSYRYHTATYTPASVSANRRTNDTIFVASMNAITWLKIGSMIILLRNINPPRLCDGTCMVIKKLLGNSLKQAF